MKVFEDSSKNINHILADQAKLEDKNEDPRNDQENVSCLDNREVSRKTTNIVNISTPCKEDKQPLRDVSQNGEHAKLNRTPRSKKQGQSESFPVTPQKNQDDAPSCIDDPPTPTANLKMLMSAAFKVAVMNEGKEKRDLFSADDDCQEDSCSTVSDSIEDKDKQPESDVFDYSLPFDCEVIGGRKSKSLGLLCQKFMSKYPDESCEGKEINLHEIAKELQVERRRIYDIVNVLESLEYVTKKGKNTYVWHGSKQLVPTLCKLKALAQKIHVNDDNNDEQVLLPNPDGAYKTSYVKIPHVWLRNGIAISEQDENDKNYISLIRQEEDAKRRKNKSLGIFCQKLLMLFMVSEDQTVALEKAAKEVIEITEDPLGKNKTKVRRLYDIANILTSMGLIEKTVVFSGVKKTAFKWVGVDLDSLRPDTETLTRTLSGADAYAPTKHSLFSRPTAMADIQLGSIRKLGARSMSANQITTKKCKLPRTKSAATISRKRSSTDIPSSYQDSAQTPENHLPPSQESLPQAEIARTIHSNDVGRGSQSAGTSPVRICPAPNVAGSPEESLFREEIKKLCERFPHKLQQRDGILQLLSACKQEETAGQKAVTSSNPQLTDPGSRCNLLDRIGKDEPTVKKSRFGSPVQHQESTSCEDQPVQQQESIKEQVNDYALFDLFDHKPDFKVHQGLADMLNNPPSYMLGGQYPATTARHISKTSIAVQTDASSIKSRKTPSPDLPTNPTPVNRTSSRMSSLKPVVISSSGSLVCRDPGVSSPDARQTSPKPYYFLGLKQSSLKNLSSADLQDSSTRRSEIATCLGADVSASKLAFKSLVCSPRTTPATPLQPTLMNSVKKPMKDSYFQMIKIPTTSINLIPKIMVSDKESPDGVVQSPNSIYEQQSVPLSVPQQTLPFVGVNANPSTPFSVLPNPLNNASEETPLRRVITLDGSGKITQRKLTGLAMDDS